MDINWYNVKIDGTSKSNELLEMPNKMGKYGKRRELEPLVRRLYKERRETDKLLSHIKYTMETFRSQFSKDDNEGMVNNCNAIIHKINTNITE